MSHNIYFCTFAMCVFKAIASNIVEDRQSREGREKEREREREKVFFRDKNNKNRHIRDSSGFNRVIGSSVPTSRERSGSIVRDSPDDDSGRITNTSAGRREG